MTKKKTHETDGHTDENKTQTTDNKDAKTSGTESEAQVGQEEEPFEERTGSEGSGATSDVKSDKRLDDEKSLLEKLAEMQDRYLRLSAEFDNYRKRTLKEKIDLTKYAGEDLLRKLLPFNDDFERALNHMEASGNAAGIKEGLDLIYVKFTDFLIQNGVTEIKSLDQSFDVDLHDAVAKVSVEEQERKGKVVEVILKGFYLKDKVLRHARVIIGE